MRRTKHAMDKSIYSKRSAQNHPVNTHPDKSASDVCSLLTRVLNNLLNRFCHYRRIFFIHMFNASDCSPESLLQDVVSRGQSALRCSTSACRMISDAWADINQQGSPPSKPYKLALEARWRCYPKARWVAKSSHHPIQKLNFDGKSLNFSYEPTKGNLKFYYQVHTKASRLPVSSRPDRIALELQAQYCSNLFLL